MPDKREQLTSETNVPRNGEKAKAGDQVTAHRQCEGSENPWALRGCDAILVTLLPRLSISPSPFIALKADLGEALLSLLPPDSTLRFSSWKLDPERESGLSERGVSWAKAPHLC